MLTNSFKRTLLIRNSRTRIHQTQLFTYPFPSLMSELRQRANAGDVAHGGAHDHSHSDEAASLLSALEGSKSRGSRITLIGLASNIGLTGMLFPCGFELKNVVLKI